MIINARIQLPVVAAGNIPAAVTRSGRIRPGADSSAVNDIILHNYSRSISSTVGDTGD